MVVVDPYSIPVEVEIVTDAGMVTERILVTGRLDQCLKCHGFGHEARACPSFLRTDAPTTPQLTHQVAQDSFRPMTSRPPRKGGGT